MPTGYTAGILNGEIKTFKDFAKVCMKAFGACQHMRADLNLEYKPQVPREYCLENIEKAKKNLEKVSKLTDEQIIRNTKKEIKEKITYYKKRLREEQDYYCKLAAMLSQAKSYNPPTPEHSGFKHFMIKQLEMTIQYDADTKHIEEDIRRAELKLENINPTELRIKLIQAAQIELSICEKKWENEVDMCNKNNKWVQDLLNSLD